MRNPTPMLELYSWHRQAMAAVAQGERVPGITMNEPQPGWYMRATGARNDPETKHLPAMIWMEQPVDENGELAGEEKLRCKVNGKDADAREQWTWLAKRPISAEQYMQIMAAHWDSGEAQPKAPDQKVGPKKRTPY